MHLGRARTKLSPVYPETKDEKAEHPLDADITEKEVHNALLHISRSTAPVKDGITYRTLKKSRRLLDFGLNRILYSIWNPGELPRTWKRVDITLPRAWKRADITPTQASHSRSRTCAQSHSRHAQAN